MASHRIKCALRKKASQGFYLVKALFQKKVLLFTDSRGFDVCGLGNYKHYSARLGKSYCVDPHLAPEKWTTILDFIDMYSCLEHSKYDAVILHAGIVDWSPRHQRVAQEIIYPDKRSKYLRLFPESECLAYLRTDFGVEYEGDNTINLYSLAMAKRAILPVLMAIPNLIWISPNRVVPGWRGNYPKDRPANMYEIEPYANLFIKSLPRVINLMVWNEDEVKRYTLDSVHPSAIGSNLIFDQLKAQLARM